MYCKPETRQQQQQKPTVHLHISATLIFTSPSFVNVTVKQVTFIYIALTLQPNQQHCCIGNYPEHRI